MDRKSFLKGLFCGIGASLVALFVAVGVFSCASGATAKKEETSGVKALRQVPKKEWDSSNQWYGDYSSLYGWRYVDLDALQDMAENQAMEFEEGRQNDGSLNLWGSFKVFAYDGSMWQSDNLCVRWTETDEWEAKLSFSIPKWVNGDDLDYVDDGSYSAVCCGEITMDTHEIQVVPNGVNYKTSLFLVESIDRAEWDLPHYRPNDLISYLDALMPSCALGYGIGDSFVVPYSVLNRWNSTASEGEYLHGDMLFISGNQALYGSLRKTQDISQPSVGYGYNPARLYNDDLNGGNGYVEVRIGDLGVDSETYTLFVYNNVRHVFSDSQVTSVIWSTSFRPARILQSCYGGILAYDGYALKSNARSNSGSTLGWEFPCLVSYQGLLYDEVRIGWDIIVEGDTTLANAYAYYDGNQYIRLDVSDLGGYSCLLVVTYIGLRTYDGVYTPIYQCEDTFTGSEGYFVINGNLRGGYCEFVLYDYDAKNVVYTEPVDYRLTSYGLWVSPALSAVTNGGYDWFGTAIDPFRLLTSGVDTMASLLGMTILPGLSLGLLFSLPLLAVIVVIVFKVIHK